MIRTPWKSNLLIGSNMGKKVSRAEQEEFITNIAMDCGQVSLDSSCGKYFNLMYDAQDRIVLESFEKNDTYGFTNINELSDKEISKIYKSLLVDFG